MPSSNDPERSGEIEHGHYARKQIFCRDWLISWSHRRRFEVGLQLAKEFTGRRVLDYGCGDGTFLAMLRKSKASPAVAVGAEIDPKCVRDCQERLGSEVGLEFLHVEALEEKEYQGTFDAVFCMEVLEHVVEVQPVLRRIKRVLAPGGRLVVSVPVETGLPLLIKQVARRVAGWRGLGDYPGSSPYTWRELVVSLFAGGRPHIQRPVHSHPDGTRFHDHKGFNWKVLAAAVTEEFQIERVLCSPVSWLPPQLASQVWLVASAIRQPGAENCSKRY